MARAETGPAPRGWIRHLPCGKPISALGFGCSSLWAKPGFEEALAAEILDVLAAEGVNHFDTGPSYGAGLGESRLGRWLSGRDAADFVITTKVGTNLIDGRIVRGFDPVLLESSFAASLARLGLDRVDVLYLHGPARIDLNPGVFAWFERQKAAGRIGLSGINSFDNAVLAAAADTPVDVIMLQHNVADFRNAAAMERLVAAGKTVMSGTALARGRFDTSSFRPTSRSGLWYLLRALRDDPWFAFKAKALAKRLESTGKPAPEAALQYLTGHPLVLSSLFGTSRPDHARANARAGHGQLSNPRWTALAGCA
ncbi:D-threo-aldose 1-dehydrogenase [Novosphingobium kunmingense]|uniref:D-threo-aldose 1-dehydrogenase n=1 Tax=Novosphingobium kunmingense TaxID=1211806 RepID=A0A2N0I1J9_9SPHN|nr:aldo/keto reductase [Novosphingobium kunmingense]PKB25050.1 D-threo-aldose 1-dehydrogenase [Novosphingobium kunmingense]